MKTTPLLELWRAIVLGIGGFNLGIGAYLLWAYSRQILWPQRPYNLRVHVLAIITSYLLLTAGLEAFILGRAVHRESITWRLVLASVAFPLGAYALGTIARGRAKNPKGE